MASDSPPRTCRSIPFSTGTATLPRPKVFVSPEHDKTNSFSPLASRVSLIPQRLGGIDARRAPARVDGRDEGKRQRHQSGPHPVHPLQVGGQPAEVVYLTRQDLEVEGPLDRGNDHVDVERGEDP